MIRQLKLWYDLASAMISPAENTSYKYEPTEKKINFYPYDSAQTTS